MNMIIRPRRDTDNRWRSLNPILRDREIAVAFTKSKTKYKVGDGITPYKQLPYVSMGYALSVGTVYCECEDEEIIEYIDKTKYINVTIRISGEENGSKEM